MGDKSIISVEITKSFSRILLDGIVIGEEYKLLIGIENEIFVYNCDDEEKLLSAPLYHQKFSIGQKVSVISWLKRGESQQFLCTTEPNHTLLIFNKIAENFKNIAIISQHNQYINDASFIDKDIIVTCSDDFSIKIFNFVQNQLIFHKQTRSPIIRCIYNPYHPNYILYAEVKGIIKIDDFVENVPKRTVYTSSPLLDVDWSLNPEEMIAFMNHERVGFIIDNVKSEIPVSSLNLVRWIPKTKTLMVITEKEINGYQIDGEKIEIHKNTKFFSPSVNFIYSQHTNAINCVIASNQRLYFKILGFDSINDDPFI